MKRVLSLIVLVMLSLFCAACARPQGYIDFTQPQDTHPAAEEPDTKDKVKYISQIQFHKK